MMDDQFGVWLKQRINGLARYARIAASRDAFDRANDAWEKRKTLIEVEAAYNRIRAGIAPKIGGLSISDVIVDEMCAHNPIPGYQFNAGAHWPGPTMGATAGHSDCSSAATIGEAIKAGDEGGLY